MANYNELKFFRNFTNDEVNNFVRLMIPVTYSEGEVIVKEGEVSHVLMLIIKGRAKVVKAIDENNYKILSILEAGDIFGEMSFFDNAPHNASVIAHTEISLLALSKKDFETFIEKNPKTAFKILFRIIQVCSQRIRNLNEEVKQLGAWCISLRNSK
ncbi:MAG: hypothetical protein OHK0040_05160 [bacterium]